MAGFRPVTLDDAPAAPAAPADGGWKAVSLDAQATTPPPDTPSFMKGITRAFAQGVAFNLGDEVEAWVRSRQSLGGSGDYEAELAKVRDEIDAFAKANPWSAGAAELVGSVAMPGGAAAGAARGAAKAGARVALGEATKAAAKSGAVQGALSGFGAGEGVESRAIGAGVGAAAGGVVGAVIPGAAAVAGRLVDGGRNLVSRVAGTGARGIADDAILEAAQKDAAANGVTLAQELNRANPAGPTGNMTSPAAVSRAGHNVQALAENAVVRGGDAPAIAREFADEVRGAQGDAFDRLRSIVPGDYQDELNKVIASRRNVAGPGYEAFYRTQHTAVPDLEPLIARSPSLRASVVEGVKSAKDVAVAKNAPQHAYFITGTNGERLWSPVQIDEVQKALRAKRDANPTVIDDLHERAMDAIDKAFPQLRGLHKQYFDHKELERAAELGREMKAGTTGLKLEQALDRFDKLTPEQQRLARIGVRDAVMDIVSRGTRDARASSHLMNNNELHDTIMRVFGNDGREIVAQIRAARTQEPLAKRLEAAAGRGERGTGVQAADAAALGLDAATYAMGVGLPGVITGMRMLHRASRMSPDVANAIAERLITLRRNGHDPQAFVDHILSLDERQRTKALKHLAAQKVLAGQAGQAGGELAAEVSSAQKRGF